MPGKIISLETKIILIFSVVLVIGIFGYFSFYNILSDYIFAHVGGLGILGLFAGLSGIIAKKKSCKYRKTFMLSFFLSVILGIIAVVLVFLSQGIMYCGGSVSLAVALLILIIVLLKKRNK